MRYVCGVDKGKILADNMEYVKNPHTKFDHYVAGEPVDTKYLTQPMTREDWFKVGDLIAANPWKYSFGDKHTERMLKVRARIMEHRDEWRELIGSWVRATAKGWPIYYIPQNIKDNIMKTVREAIPTIFKTLGPSYVRFPLYAYMLERYYNGSIYDVLYDPLLIYWNGDDASPFDITDTPTFCRDYMRAIHYIQDTASYTWLLPIYKRDKAYTYFLRGCGKERLEEPTPHAEEDEQKPFMQYVVRTRLAINCIYSMYWLDRWLELIDRAKRMKPQNIIFGTFNDVLHRIGKGSMFSYKRFFDYEFDTITRSEFVSTLLWNGYMTKYIVEFNFSRLRQSYHILKDSMHGGFSFLDIPFGPIGAPYRQSKKPKYRTFDVQKHENMYEPRLYVEGWIHYEPTKYRASEDDDYDNYWTKVKPTLYKPFEALEEHRKKYKLKYGF